MADEVDWLDGKCWDKAEVYIPNLYMQLPVQVVEQHIQGNNHKDCGSNLLQAIPPSHSFRKLLHIHPTIYLGSQYKSMMPSPDRNWPIRRSTYTPRYKYNAQTQTCPAQQPTACTCWHTELHTTYRYLHLCRTRPRLAAFGPFLSSPCFSIILFRFFNSCLISFIGTIEHRAPLRSRTIN